MDGGRNPGLISVNEALTRLDAIAPLPSRSVLLAGATGRVLADRVYAACDLPPFTQSAVDGYAVRHADLARGALPLAGTVRAAAQVTPPVLAPGTALRIHAGAMFPEGADTVVRKEWAEAGPGALRVLREVVAGADVRRRGEDLRKGGLLAEPGLRLAPRHVAALAAAGVSQVSVRDAPRICVLVTGDEVARPGVACRAGQVPDANGPLVTSWLAAQGYSKVRLEYVAGSAAAIQVALERAFDRADLVLTTGGVSDGPHDHVPDVAAALGARPLLWKVAQRPGMPLFAALHGRVPLLGLPGSPAAVLVNLLAYARRALDRIEGVARPGPAFATGVLEAAVPRDPERDVWLRMAQSSDDNGCRRLSRLPGQGSHMFSTLLLAGALARVPAGRGELAAGAPVRYLVLHQ